jgi:hypothetical protein
MMLFQIDLNLKTHYLQKIINKQVVLIMEQLVIMMKQLVIMMEQVLITRDQKETILIHLDHQNHQPQDLKPRLDQEK